MRLKSALASHQAQAKRHALEAKARERAAAQKQKSGSGAGSAVGGANKKKRPNQPGQSTSTSSSSSLPASSSTLAPTADIPSPPVRKAKPVIPFDKQDTILLLGEANFSFAASLLQPPHNLSGHMICATSYDTEDVCYKKYGDAKVKVDELRGKGARVIFGVDAGDLPSSVVGKGKEKEKGGRWSRVIFNFPHAGAGIKDQDRNIITNQHLLLRTLRCVHPILTSGPPPGAVKPHLKRKRPDSDNEEDPTDADFDQDFEDETAELEASLAAMEDTAAAVDILNPAPSSFTPPNRRGTVLFTLLDQNPYTLWNLPSLAKRPPQVCPGTNLAQPRYKLIRSFEFNPEVYTGYTHRRTLGFKEGLSKGANEEIMGRKGKARTWEFARWEGEEEVKKKKVKGVKMPKGKK